MPQKIEQRIDTQISILVQRWKFEMTRSLEINASFLCLDDHSRVHLHTSPTGNDYINANHVDVCTYVYMPSTMSGSHKRIQIDFDNNVNCKINNSVTCLTFSSRHMAKRKHS
jgi:hypothetical protein